MMKQFERPKYCFMNKTWPGVCKLKITNFSVVYIYFFSSSLYQVNFNTRTINNNIMPIVRLKDWRQNNAEQKKIMHPSSWKFYSVKPSSSLWRVIIQTMAKVKMILIYRDRIRKTIQMPSIEWVLGSSKSFDFYFSTENELTETWTKKTTTKNTLGTQNNNNSISSPIKMLRCSPMWTASGKSFNVWTFDTRRAEKTNSPDKIDDTLPDRQSYHCHIQTGTWILVFLSSPVLFDLKLEKKTRRW